MPKQKRLIRQFLVFAALCFCGSAPAVELRGEPVQGGLIFGQSAPGSSASLDGTPLMVSATGHFVFGFGRDDAGSVTLEVKEPNAETWTKNLSIAPRDYNIERVDGLPPSKVNPPPEVLARIRDDNAQVAQARNRRDQRTDYADGFIWPAQGRLSGFYGSQRVLNGEPRRPHFGVDVAAPEGTLVVAPAPGIVTLSHKDMYYSGGTMIIDHGQGLSSTFLHLSEVLVPAGTEVAQGDPVARIGATGRATGPHLDWRMNWLGKRVDPQPLAGDMPTPSATP
jgi:murein DD-endopeptidase MepM/ murein hydrolase activator NlpD